MRRPPRPAPLLVCRTDGPCLTVGVAWRRGRQTAKISLSINLVSLFPSFASFSLAAFFSFPKRTLTSHVMSNHETLLNIRENKQQPSRNNCSHQFSCRLVSFHFLNYILITSPVGFTLISSASHMPLPQTLPTSSTRILWETCLLNVYPREKG